MRKSDPGGCGPGTFRAEGVRGRQAVRRRRGGDAGGHADRFTYGHDRSGNVLWKKNELSATHSELYMADGADEQAAYDKLDRLVEFQRGTLSDAVGSDGYYDTVSTSTRSQVWSLDALGNWSSLTNDGGSAQTRTNDVQNRIATVSGATSPVHSANGEMTTDETGQTPKYDAWGMVIEINVDGTGAVEITNAYDALHRRIKRNSNDLYYTAKWQQIEERDAQGVEAQFVWSSIYIDAMVLKDRDLDNDGTMEATDERLYMVHDANFNITALLDASGIVLERFIYDAYGTRSVLDANWSADADGQSDSGFQFGHQGGLHDLIARLVHFRDRWLHTTLGRWTEQDRLHYQDGGNLYQGYMSRPTSGLDPWGLRTQAEDNAPWTKAECCEVGRRRNEAEGHGFWGEAICCNGVAIACDYREPEPGEDPTATDAIRACTLLHENIHVALDADDFCQPAPCGIARPNGSRIPPENVLDSLQRECRALVASHACLAAMMVNCRTAKCFEDIAGAMADLSWDLQFYCKNAIALSLGITDDLIN